MVATTARAGNHTAIASGHTDARIIAIRALLVPSMRVLYQIVPARAGGRQERCDQPPRAAQAASTSANSASNSGKPNHHESGGRLSSGVGCVL